jgi:UDP-N-acetylmuramoyl-tripeptide--D-alanyl-D-alanine ligase
VGAAAAAYAPEFLIAVAGDAKLLSEAATAAGTRSEFVPDAAAATELLLSLLSGPAVVLVKASRGVRAERVVEAVIAALGQGPQQPRDGGRAA